MLRACCAAAGLDVDAPVVVSAQTCAGADVLLAQRAAARAAFDELLGW